MIFSKLGSAVQDLGLSIEREKLELVDTFNFLGLTIEKHLNWTPHCNNIALKLFWTLGNLKRLKSYFLSNILQIIYYSLFHSHLNYELLSWGYKYHSIHGLQKKAIRIISKSHFRAHTDPLFSELNILQLPDLHDLVQLIFYYKHFQKIYLNIF